MTQSDSKTQHKLKISFETVGSITAIIVGIAALLLSWDQGRLMREEIRASVWPALQVDGFVDKNDESLRMGIRVQNAGVGPALVQQISVLFRDELLSDINALTQKMPPQAERSYETITGRVIAAGDEVTPFTFRYQPDKDNDNDAIDELYRIANDWVVEICYCSTLKQCWVSDLNASAPREVKQCRLKQSIGL